MSQDTILVVDDNKDNLDLMLVTLSQKDYRLLASTSGEKALDIIEKVKPDLILMDIQMPGMDGFTTTKHIKEKEDLKHIPVLFLSALNDMESIIKCFESGGVDYISKPFREEELLARVRTHLSLKKLRERTSKDRDALESLLEHILPEHIISKLKAGEMPEPTYAENAVILFTDFVDFTKLSKKLGSKKTIEHLNALYSTFDQIATHFGLERLKIIGDSYMAIGNVNDTIDQPHLRGVLAGLKIQDFLTIYNQTSEHVAWQARIGANVGTVMTGVLGAHRIAFDVWGEAVNLASRLENKAITSGVTVAENVHKEIEDVIESYSRGKFTLHNVGETELFQCKKLIEGNGRASTLFEDLPVETLLQKHMSKSKNKSIFELFMEYS